MRRVSSAAGWLGPAFAVLALAGCATGPVRATQTFASPAVTQAVLALDKPAPDRARIVVFNGGSTGGTKYEARSYAVDVFVNGARIGTLNRSEAMVLDVRPGSYTFRWEGIGGKGLAQSSVPATYSFAGGSFTPVQTDNDGILQLIMKQGFGPYQLTTDDSGRQQIQPNTEIVLPSSCPPTVCLPLN